MFLTSDSNGAAIGGIGVASGDRQSGAGRVIATQLWGVSAYDPWTLTCVPVLLIITGWLRVGFRRGGRRMWIHWLRYGTNKIHFGWARPGVAVFGERQRANALASGGKNGVAHGRENRWKRGFAETGG